MDTGGLPKWVVDGRLDPPLLVNGVPAASAQYVRYHRERVAFTMSEIRKAGGRKIVEVGGHPWMISACLAESKDMELCATVSAEEVSEWPDDIPLTRKQYQMVTPSGTAICFPNYSVNVERRVFEIEEKPDMVIACEIAEHLIRSPHVMFLNINRWLPQGGRLFVTTPNGAQFSNPFRRKSKSPPYRSSVYARHNHVYTLAGLIDLVEISGFRVLASGCRILYGRDGLRRLYDVAAHIPGAYWREKFSQTIWLSAEKRQDVRVLPRAPRMYHKGERWEMIQE